MQKEFRVEKVIKRKGDKPSGLNNLKSKVSKLDVSKLIPVPFYLIKLSDAVKNDAVKNTEYNELVKKVNNMNTIDTSN